MAGFLGLILISPLFILTAVLVMYYNGKPVIFTQVRPGYNEKPFKMIKFRSMTNETDVSGNLLPNEKRLTDFGRFLRQTSLDELPELLNVIKGEMSLVGPRPLIMDYLPYFTDEQRKRHTVKPGITGWSQINGRNAIDWDTKLALDVWYVENQTFWLDMKILVITILKVFKREGITHEGSVAMPRFDEYVNKKRQRSSYTDSDN